MQLIKQVCKEWNKENAEYHTSVSLTYRSNARITIKSMYNYRGISMCDYLNKYDKDITREYTLFILESLKERFDRYAKEII